MIDAHIVRSALDKIDDAFDLYFEDRISPLVLSVNLRRHATDLRVFDENVYIALSGLADNVEAAGKADKPKPAVRDLQKRFGVWKADTLKVMDSLTEKRDSVIEATKEADRRKREADAELVRAAEQALAARAVDVDAAAKAAADKRAATPPAAAEDPGMQAALAEVDELGGTAAEADPAADAEAQEMTIEEIEKILDQTRKKL